MSLWSSPQDGHTATELERRNKRFRKSLRIMPWRDRWELEATGRGLLLVVNRLDEWSDADSRQLLEAIDTIAVWKARSTATEELPHAIESTALLAQVSWRDRFDQGNSISVAELRLAYSSAIVRCINGFADSLQQERFVAAPISTLCKQLGIPSWLVDVRHDASHNSLPTLPVLRLATTNLLQYLRSIFWITTCPALQPIESTDANHLNEINPPNKGLSILLQYKVCATKLATENYAKGQDDSVDASLTKSENIRKRARSSSETKKPFDTFFGDSEGGNSSDEDGYEDPLLGNLWGNSLGSSSNRFSILDTTSKKRDLTKKNKKKKLKKSPHTQPRKKHPGEKFPLDHARDFVKLVAPLEGCETAIQFLVWGGIGGTTQGRGVLIPGSVASFPSTNQGVQKSWHRYLPLIEVCSLAWPGFSSTLLVHLVDFVLSIEAQSRQAQEENAGATRKLFFLGAWIRLLLSDRFVGRVRPDLKSADATCKSKKKRNKRDTLTDVTLAEYQSLVVLGYPLNSLYDRCSEGSTESSLSPFQSTSREICGILQKILGESHRVPFHGLPESIRGDSSVQVTWPRPNEDQGDTITTHDENDDMDAPGAQNAAHGPALSDGKMSLDDMEALLSDEDETEDSSQKEEEEDKRGIRQGAKAVVAGDPTAPGGNLSTRPAWIKCQAWDPCALGILPGHTM